MLHSLRAARLRRGHAREPDASSSDLIAVGDEVVIWGALVVAAAGTRPACRPTPREQGLPIQNGRIVGSELSQTLAGGTRFAIHRFPPCCSRAAAIRVAPHAPAMSSAVTPFPAT